MKKALIVVDMQNDFVTGSLGNAEAVKIVPKVLQKIKTAKSKGVDVIFTRDTHHENYLDTNEGRHLPVVHCIEGSEGWQIVDALQSEAELIFNKPTFASQALVDFAKTKDYDAIELVGLCTDICVVCNALLIKSALPEAAVSVDASCCAGVTPDSHQAALKTMEMCQVDII